MTFRVNETDIQVIGRDDELAVLGALLDEARVGRSSAVVLRGEAGIGKTALLGALAALATDFTVVEVVGTRSEAVTLWVGLGQVCRALVSWTDRLPPTQWDSLRGALALGPAQAGDRFSIGVAVLSLLS